MLAAGLTAVVGPGALACAAAWSVSRMSEEPPASSGSELELVAFGPATPAPAEPLMDEAEERAPAPPSAGPPRPSPGEEGEASASPQSVEQPRPRVVSPKPASAQQVRVEEPRPKPAAASRPVVVDGVTFDGAHAARALIWLNSADEQAVRAAGVYGRGVSIILEQRPFPSVEAFGATPFIGEKTVAAVADATR